MLKRTNMSASCSFGMMAQLSNMGATKSPCAKILAYRPPAEFEKLQVKDAHAEVRAENAVAEWKNWNWRNRGPGQAPWDPVQVEPLVQAPLTEKAASLRAFAEAMRKKNVLMEIVANRWCGGVW